MDNLALALLQSEDMAWPGPLSLKHCCLCLLLSPLTCLLFTDSVVLSGNYLPSVSLRTALASVGPKPILLPSL